MKLIYLLTVLITAFAIFAFYAQKYQQEALHMHGSVNHSQLATETTAKYF